MELQQQKLKTLIDTGNDMDASADPHDHHERQILQACDDLTGEELGPDMVMEARRKEMTYIQDKHMWKVINREEAQRTGWKLMQTRWIHVKKGLPEPELPKPLGSQ